MKPVDCPNCGESVPFFARACGYCGAPNPARRRVAFVAVALASVALALVVATLVVSLTGIAPKGDATSSSGQPITGTGDDFAWVANAMTECDRQAAKEPNTLQFLVVPMVDDPPDDRGWRRISLNDIGNAILINAEDTLAGLKRKALRISTDSYVFSARNEDTKVVYRWSASTGVRKFVVADGSAIQSFKIQFESSDAGRAANWGATFVRKPGNCYWVNAIIRP
jgi:hypothetical protein